MSVNEQAIMVFSGPKERRSECAQALIKAGFGILPDSVQEQLGSFGLPSYTDPIVAHAAGSPNSGHQIDQPHPAVLSFLVQKGDHEKGCTVSDEGKVLLCSHIGQVEEREHACENVGDPYEDDDSIGWLCVVGEGVNSAKPAAEYAGWILRLHTQPSVRALHEIGDTRFTPPTMDEMFAELEKKYAILRGN